MLRNHLDGSEWQPIAEGILWPTFRKLQTCPECVDFTLKPDNLLPLGKSKDVGAESQGGKRKPGRCVLTEMRARVRARLGLYTRLQRLLRWEGCRGRLGVGLGVAVEIDGP